MTIWHRQDGTWTQHYDSQRASYEFTRPQAEREARRLSRFDEARVCLGSTPGAYVARYVEGELV